MFTVEIVQAKVDVVTGTSKSGRSFCFHNQPGIVRCSGDSGFSHIDGKDIVLSIDDAKPLAVGVYRVLPRSFYVDGYGKLRFLLKVEPESHT